ncbi:MAG: FAD:protein FMN transferase [Eubacteriales bacterium]|nr:FAD:protein FMN transferase [Eubacteriales bacterium]
MQRKLLLLICKCACNCVCTIACTIAILASTLMTGCTANNKKTSVTGYKLNTIIQIDAYSNTDADILNGALDLCDTYEKMFSRTMTDSLLYQVNSHQITEIPQELAQLIQYGIKYSELSMGAFDLTIGSISQLWDFTASKPEVPAASAIANALQYVDYTRINLTQNKSSKAASNQDNTWSISIPEGTIIDLGAIAKGYIADRIKEYLVENGVKKAIINLGGNVLCIGRKTNTSNFSIGIKKPFSENGESLAVLSLDDKSAVSSGTYERYFYSGEDFYHHILNPYTGYPYNNGLTSVTIISDNSITGDCLSTTCFTLGLQEGLKLIESTDGVEAVFVTEDKNLHYSSGAKAYIQ